MMMNGGMDSMMGWMMGLGLLGWVLVIALLATIVVLLFRLLGRQGRGQDRGSTGPGSSAGRSESS
jgi:uncharacterized membrane protein